MTDQKETGLTADEILELKILRIVTDDELTEAEKARRLLELFRAEQNRKDEHD